MIPSNLLTNPIIIRSAIDYYRKTKNDDRWDRFIEVSEKPQRKYRVKMRELFTNQLEDVLTNLNRKSIKTQYDAEYIDWNQYRIQYNEFSQLELPGIMTAWADLELQALEVGISFDVLDPNVISAVTNRSNLFSDSVVNETRTLLHRIIADSIQAGDGIPTIEKKIRLLYENMSKFRSTRIARTEIIFAQNEGAEQGYIQSNVVKSKRWIVARDERLCGWCSEMGNKDPFELGSNYFNLGESMTIEENGKIKRMTFNYEPISHPPLHPFVGAS